MSLVRHSSKLSLDGWFLFGSDRSSPARERASDRSQTGQTFDASHRAKRYDDDSDDASSTPHRTLGGIVLPTLNNSGFALSADLSLAVRLNSAILFRYNGPQ